MVAAEGNRSLVSKISVLTKKMHVALLASLTHLKARIMDGC